MYIEQWKTLVTNLTNKDWRASERLIFKGKASGEECDVPALKPRVELSLTDTELGFHLPCAVFQYASPSIATGPGMVHVFVKVSTSACLVEVPVPKPKKSCPVLFKNVHQRGQTISFRPIKMIGMTLYFFYINFCWKLKVTKISAKSVRIISQPSQVRCNFFLLFVGVPNLVIILKYVNYIMLED